MKTPPVATSLTSTSSFPWKPGLLCSLRASYARIPGACDTFSDVAVLATFIARVVLDACGGAAAFLGMPGHGHALELGSVFLNNTCCCEVSASFQRPLYCAFSLDLCDKLHLPQPPHLRLPSPLVCTFCNNPITGKSGLMVNSAPASAVTLVCIPCSNPILCESRLMVVAAPLCVTSGTPSLFLSILATVMIMVGASYLFFHL